MEVQILNINNILIKLFFNKLGKRRKNIINKFINNSYPNIQNYLDKNFINSYSLDEKLYRLKYNLKEIPKCPICNKYKKFLSFKLGYSNTCSKECSRKLAIINTKKTKLEKYGSSTYNNSNKRNETNLLKYGYKCPLSNNLIKEKAKETSIKNYGVDNILKIKEIHNKGVKRSQDQDIKEKRNKTIYEKYNVNNIFQSEIIKIKKEKTFIKRYGYKNNFGNKQTQIKCNGIEGINKRFNTMTQNN